MEVSSGSFPCQCFLCSTLGKCILQKSFPYIPLRSTEMPLAPYKNLITKDNCIEEKVKGRRICFQNMNTLESILSYYHDCY